MWLHIQVFQKHICTDILGVRHVFHYCQWRKTRCNDISTERSYILTLDFHIIFWKKEPELVEEMVESGLSKNTICYNFQETYETRKQGRVPNIKKQQINKQKQKATTL